MSQYTYWCNSLTTNLDIGNSLASIIGNEPGDALAFTKGTPLKAIGGSNDVVAWGVAVALKSTGASSVTEFNGTGPYPILNSLGVTNDQIATAKAFVKSEVSLRSSSRDATEFWAEHGYAPVPRTLEMV